MHKGDALFPRIDVAKEIAHLKEEDEKRKAAAEAANKAKAGVPKSRSSFSVRLSCVTMAQWMRLPTGVLSP